MGENLVDLASRPWPLIGEWDDIKIAARLERLKELGGYKNDKVSHLYHIITTHHGLSHGLKMRSKYFAWLM